jgi:hypothetical protein
MKNIFSALLLTIPIFVCLSCGKKGDILPPLIRFPQTALEVQIAQKAEEIILTWRNPIAYEDGSTLSDIDEIEIWVLELDTADDTEFPAMQAEEFGQKAKLHATIGKGKIPEYLVKDSATEGLMCYSYRLTGKDFLSKAYTFGLRVKDPKRYSPFSELVFLKPMVLPLPPTDITAAMNSDRITLEWHPPTKNRDQSTPPNLEGYNIYRSEEGGKPQRLNASLIKSEKYEDEDFVFGQIYRYYVRASATDTSPYLESEDSEAAEILTKDTFPPEPPKDLISVAGQDVLAISWDANTEDDLDGYRVWRRKEGETEFRLLTPDPIRENAYNDKAVEKGIVYVYAVTALDRDGNESKKSNTISDSIRERIG